MQQIEPTEEPNQASRWKKFQRLSVDRKDFERRLRKAESASQRHAHRFILKRLSNLRESRAEIARWLAIAVVIIIGIGVQFFLFSKSSSVEAAQAGGTYVEGVSGKLDTLNPLYVSSGAEAAISKLLFSSLLKYDTSGHLQSDVATSVKTDEKGLNYTVALRQDVYWHDGVKLKAEDVVFTIDTIKNASARVRSSLRVNWLDITVKAQDDYTVIFTLPVGYSAFVHALTFPIVPKHTLAQIQSGALQESAFSRSPIGSGPFIFKLLQTTDAPGGTGTNKTVHLIANDRYYDGKPKLERFELNAYANPTNLANAVKTHEVTAAVDVSQNAFTDLNVGDYKVQRYRLDNAVYLIQNMTANITKETAVRKAVQVGLDRQKIRDQAGKNLPSIDLPFITGQVAGELPAAPTYDSAKAKAYLEEAGWKIDGEFRKKDGVELALRLLTTKTDQFEKAANEIARQLKTVGIRVDIEVVDTTNPAVNFITRVLQPRDFDLLLYELPIGADPDVYAYWHSSQLGFAGYNFANYSNGLSDAALASARSQVDAGLRDSKYIAFAKQWLSDAPAVGLYQQVGTYIINENASAMPVDAQFVINADRYTDVTSWTSGRRSVYKTP